VEGGCEKLAPKRRPSLWEGSPSLFAADTVKVKIWYVTAMHPTESKNTDVSHVTNEVERILHHRYPEERREEIIKAYQERSSMRGLTRTFGVAHNTVKDWLKKGSFPPSPEGHIDCARSK